MDNSMALRYAFWPDCQTGGSPFSFQILALPQPLAVPHNLSQQFAWAGADLDEPDPEMERGKRSDEFWRLRPRHDASIKGEAIDLVPEFPLLMFLSSA
jgi:hypothetical protein